MKKIILLLVVGLVLGNLRESELLFTEWQLEHKKVYSDNLEATKRLFIFKQNIEKISQMNHSQMGGQDVEFGLNQFSDMTQEEFEAQILMNETTPQAFDENRYLKKPNINGPDTFDWRDHGAVTDVKDQGSCGTCWAFSTTGNIEGLVFVKTSKLLRLSEEQLVDCDGTQDLKLKRADCGVFGGWPYLAYQYIIKNGGIDPEEEYPYCVGGGTYEKSCFPCMAPGWTEELCGPPIAYCDATRWPCKKERSQNAIVLKDWAAIGTDEEDIAQHLIKEGPLSIGLNASMLQFYRKGVFDPMFCKTTTLNHAVLLIGYGTSEKGKQYWTVKNSWGLKWGEQGYFRIARGKGKCGINTIVATGIL